MKLAALRIIALPLTLTAVSSTLSSHASEFNVGGIGALSAQLPSKVTARPSESDREHAGARLHLALNMAAQAETKTFVDIGSMLPQDQAPANGAGITLTSRS